MIYFRALIFSFLILAFSIPAAAQSVVIGKGNAGICYEYARSMDMGSRGALRTCNEALKEDLSVKNRAATYVNLGILLMRKEDFTDAITNYKSALELKPDLTEAHVNMGAALIYQDQLEPALAAINIALQDVDSDTRPAALLNRAVIYDRQEKYVLAYRDLKEAGTLKPNWEKVDQFLSRYTVIQKS